ncbi:ParB/RepB/Spo0J family partition protein [Streptomyces goshikiensis]|uniref:ParB/RepB/Spo0J family partition protein n=1 Tax=Streptomyces goshikiensis TaxID=1942 RepID=UPI003662D240
MSKADRLGGSATFDAVAQPISSRAASFARFAGQDAVGPVAGEPSVAPAPQGSRLPVEELAHNPFNPREELKDVAELADSLAARGVIQPLTVVTRAAFLTAHPGHETSLAAAGYVVVDGNRRLAAARLAGLDEVPVHMDDSLAEDADTLLESALVAAIQHRDLEPLEEAQALQRLVEKYGSQRKVATALHKSSGWVTQRLALLKLTPELQQAVEEKTLPVEVARRVGQLPQQQQQGAADEALHVRAEKPKPKRKREPGREGESAQEGPAGAGSAYGVSTPLGGKSAEGGSGAESAYGVSTSPGGEPAGGGSGAGGAYGVSTSRGGESAEGAYAVSTPRRGESAQGGPAGAESAYGVSTSGGGESAGGAYGVSTLPGRESEGSAYGVSTSGAVVGEEEAGQDSEEFPMVDIRRLPRVPWHDGKEVAGLILQKMDATQRAILLEHLLAARADG